MFLKKRNIISKMKRSKVTDYAALNTRVMYVTKINFIIYKVSRYKKILIKYNLYLKKSYISHVKKKYFTGEKGKKVFYM